ncbi:(d)CMP kinase [Ornithinibacillus halophilus]|uniref:Cytidylate kinase n=1 Tax=Ornithinibacillus halophilus TaxID=930117 RepID=A0A1M5CRI8_9BACI|nr:(d)CMP kinase [Ornithinibacillus halophilus]SHF57256.1 cytidylate kinase [Ornithinibacillus halophilus]
MTNKNIAIAIDGPAAAGKSTVAKIVANKLSYIYIDTGAMYRALTLKAINQQTSLQDEKRLSELLSTTKIDLEQSKDGQRVILDGEDVTLEIRSQQVTNNVSHVAKHASVRREMVLRQQQLANKRGVVMDGRDIGTHVLPDAEVKVFLVASVEERARRRHEENIKKGFDSNLQQLMDEINQRDQIDSKRETAPLIKAADAIEIDTTSLTIDDVANKIFALANEKL